MVTVDIVGLRDLRGRFASLRDAVLLEIQTQEADALAKTMEEIYRRYAPRSRGHTATGRHFFEGLRGEAMATPVGFQVSVSTDNAQLRGWLKTGTGIYGPTGRRIYPRRAKAMGPVFNWLHPAGGTGPFWFRSIAGMHANPWEDQAQAEALPLAVAMGARIGTRMTRYLAHGV